MGALKWTWTWTCVCAEWPCLALHPSSRWAATLSSILATSSLGSRKSQDQNGRFCSSKREKEYEVRTHAMYIQHDHHRRQDQRETYRKGNMGSHAAPKSETLPLCKLLLPSSMADVSLIRCHFPLERLHSTWPFARIMRGNQGFGEGKPDCEEMTNAEEKCRLQDPVFPHISGV
ncbi:hypothetical protein BJ166DRAFT_505927 [Pestalotiopsis sp. NC0098]|nr:hypothetical protein BJ166DRAFT_505927 [Pestalotiopsis sp. NC0098]